VDTGCPVAFQPTVDYFTSAYPASKRHCSVAKGFCAATGLAVILQTLLFSGWRIDHFRLAQDGWQPKRRRIGSGSHWRPLDGD
jgi:hypothetical protein